MVHIIRSGSFTFKEILSESPIIFNVSASVLITLEDPARAKGTL